LHAALEEKIEPLSAERLPLSSFRESSTATGAPAIREDLLAGGR
jgi:hypothetical protein